MAYMERGDCITQMKEGLQSSVPLLHPCRSGVLGVVTGVGYHCLWKQGTEHKVLFLSSVCVSPVY